MAGKRDPRGALGGEGHVSRAGAESGDPRRSSDGEGHADLVISRQASRQRGLVTLRGLLDAGLTYAQVEYRLAIGRLHLVHRGVYVTGHPVLAPLAPELAAVMACGDGALLSHRSAAVLWDLLTPTVGPIDITLTRGRRAPRAGIRLHRAAGLQPARRHGIPTTTPARILLDLAATEPASLPAAVDEAHARRLVDLERLTVPPGHRGAARLRALVAGGRPITDSEAERMLLRLIARAGLPRPLTQTRIGPFRVDALWSGERLVVEVDGYAFHAGRTAFERDRRRDAQLVATGHRVVRVTWRQLTREPEAVVARLAAALATVPSSR